MGMEIRAQRFSASQFQGMTVVSAVRRRRSHQGILPVELTDWYTGDDAGNNAAGKDLWEGLDMRKALLFVSGFGM